MLPFASFEFSHIFNNSVQITNTHTKKKCRMKKKKKEQKSHTSLKWCILSIRMFLFFGKCSHNLTFQVHTARQNGQKTFKKKKGKKSRDRGDYCVKMGSKGLGLLFIWQCGRARLLSSHAVFSTGFRRERPFAERRNETNRGFLFRQTLTWGTTVVDTGLEQSKQLRQFHYLTVQA